MSNSVVILDGARTAMSILLSATQCTAINLYESKFTLLSAHHKEMRAAKGTLRELGDEQCGFC